VNGGPKKPGGGGERAGGGGRERKQSESEKREREKGERRKKGRTLVQVSASHANRSGATESCRLL
jgi:hypothetical protein